MQFKLEADRISIVAETVQDRAYLTSLGYRPKVTVYSDTDTNTVPTTRVHRCDVVITSDKP